MPVRGVGSELRDRLAGAESADRVPLSPTQLFFLPLPYALPRGSAEREMSPSRARAWRLPAARSRCSRTPPQTLTVGISVSMGNTPILNFFFFGLNSAGSNHTVSLYLRFYARLPGADGWGGARQHPPPGYGDNTGCATPPLSPHGVRTAVPRRPGCDMGLGGERGSWSGAFPPAAACAPAPPAITLSLPRQYHRVWPTSRDFLRSSPSTNPQPCRRINRLLFGFNYFYTYILVSWGTQPKEFPVILFFPLYKFSLACVCGAGLAADAVCLLRKRVFAPRLFIQELSSVRGRKGDSFGKQQRLAGEGRSPDWVSVVELKSRGGDFGGVFSSFFPPFFSTTGPRGSRFFLRGQSPAENTTTRLRNSPFSSLGAA